jgi:ubiquitin-protein ligase
MRRLRTDAAALERLEAESTILTYKASGKPPQKYVIEFRGKSLARESGKVVVRTTHRAEIKLGASYPRSMPELRWLTPIYHPNISEIGMVCLGGYGTHWVPSLKLDALCVMLWDMARFYNYDIRSPYNRDAALWAAHQTSIGFPVDPRPLRDLRVARGRIDDDAERIVPPVSYLASSAQGEPPTAPSANGPAAIPPAGEILILDATDDPTAASETGAGGPPQDEILFITD